MFEPFRVQILIDTDTTVTLHNPAALACTAYSTRSGMLNYEAQAKVYRQTLPTPTPMMQASPGNYAPSAELVALPNKHRK
jgi:hypothetical protein